MTETREERSKRLASYRTNAVLEKLRILGNLSNTSNYQYSEAEIEKMFSAIRKQLNVVQAKFRKPKKDKFEI